MICFSCTLQDKHKSLSNYDDVLPNGDPFIPRSADFKTNLSVQTYFYQDLGITTLDSKIATTKIFIHLLGFHLR
jgi:hypothetical protein